MKWVLRFQISIVIACLIASTLLGIYSTPPVPIENPIVIALFILGFLCAIFSYLYLLYHWGMSCFRAKSNKRLWLFVLLAGTPFYFVGPFAYYIVVYEQNRGGLEKSL